MKPKAILLVHGMGKNSPPTATSPGSFGQQFIDATTTTLQQFAKHKDDKLANYFDLYEFNYDKYCVGWASHGGDNGFFLSLDVLQAIDSKKSKLEYYRGRLGTLLGH